MTGLVFKGDRLITTAVAVLMVVALVLLVSLGLVSEVLGQTPVIEHLAKASV